LKDGQAFVRMGTPKKAKRQSIDDEDRGSLSPHWP